MCLENLKSLLAISPPTLNVKGPEKGTETGIEPCYARLCHAQLNFPLFFLQLHLINRALLDTFQDTIPSSWRPEDAAAWEILLNFFTKKLKEGIRTGSKKIQVH